jgi:hypothetical protein
MPKIVGFEDIQSTEQLQQELQQGGKFVMYQYCISFVVITFKRWSKVYFTRHDQSAMMQGLPFTLLTLVLGWWGFPWGPIYTIQTLWINLRGGKDITRDITGSMVSTSPKAS